MIKNTCPNAGTPSPGLPAERACPDAGLAAAGTAAITPAASASTDTNITPNLGRIRHPAFSAGKARRVRSAHHRHRQYLPHRRARGGSRAAVISLAPAPLKLCGVAGLISPNRERETGVLRPWGRVNAMVDDPGPVPLPIGTCAAGVPPQATAQRTTPTSGPSTHPT